MIKYQSLSMPVIVLSETCTDDTDNEISVECENDKRVNTASNSAGPESSEKKEGRYKKTCTLFCYI